MNNPRTSARETFPLGRLRHVLGHTFFFFPLKRESTILDLGANHGRFSAILHQLTDAQCTAIEPTPALYNQIVDGPRLKKMQYAISGHCGEADFHISDQSEASGLARVAIGSEVAQISVPTITLDALIEQGGVRHLDLVKMDIEGAELMALLDSSDQTLLRVAQITIEFHDFCGLLSRHDVERIRDRFRALGFREFRFSRSNMDVLFVNTRFLSLSFIDVLHARYTARLLLWALKAVQIVRKKLS